MPILGILASSKLVKPVVTGGTLTSDATYFYRTFLANGTLGITGGSLTYDTIIVAGGGGGGHGDDQGFNPGISFGGGGGAGGLSALKSQT